MDRICVTVMDRQQLQSSAVQGADLVELRLDYLGADGWPELVTGLGKPVIVTWRRFDQGGAPHMRDVPEEERLQVLRDAAVHPDVAYVDVEDGCQDAIPRERSAKLIVSRHDFEGTPRDLEDRCLAIAAQGADVVKYAVQAHSELDSLAVYRALRACRERRIPAVILSMGEYGQASRVLGLREGALWTYGRIAGGAEGGPGQYSVSELQQVYRTGAIDADTDVYGVIGDPIAHSMSPVMLNAAFVAKGLNAVYVSFKVSGDPAAFVRAMQELPVKGFSVTIPHKQGVMAACDEIEPAAREIGAVNTVSAGESGLLGSNSDEAGALDPLRALLQDQGRDLAGLPACVLGAGGAARAVVAGLTRAGAKVTVANRTVARAEELAAAFGARAGGLDIVERDRFAVLVNTTPVGMHPKVDASPVGEGALHKDMVVFDTVYNPLTTKLLEMARARGCRTLDGLAMFVGQGAAQFTRWTGLEAPLKAMREACLQRLQG
jgi:3-dehydroquinate dehydratase/shikimate dehydrogenase